MQQHVARTIVLCVFLASSAVATWAAQGRTPIPSSTPLVFPVVIDEPGSYVVTRDLTASSGSVIQIDATGVVLDLGGRVLTGQGAPIVSVAPSAAALIRNGTLSGGTGGVSAQSGSDLTLEDVSIAGTSGAGVSSASATRLGVIGCTIENAGSAGIWVFGVGTSGVIRGNRIRSTADGVVVQNGASLEISENSVRDIVAGFWGGVGVFLSQSDSVIVMNNDVSSTAGNGIWVGGGSDACRLDSNIVSGAGSIGILYDAASGSLRANSVSNSGGHGIQVRGQRNFLSENEALGNGSWGLYFNTQSADNVFRLNRAAGNGGAECNGSDLNPDYCNSGPGNSSHGDNWLPSLE